LGCRLKPKLKTSLAALRKELLRVFRQRAVLVAEVEENLVAGLNILTLCAMG